MRLVALVMVLLAASPAGARPPIRFDDDRIDLRDHRHLRERLAKVRLPKPCPRTKVWSRYASCFRARKQTFRVLHATPAARLIALDQTDYATGSKRLELHVLAAGAWVKTGFYAETSPLSELLAFAKLDGEAYRIDMGYASTTWVTLDDVASRPARLRRTYSYVCSASSCQGVQTSCDVLVHGKAIESFRGALVWDGRMVKVRGDVRNVQRYCVVGAGALVD